MAWKKLLFIDSGKFFDLLNKQMRRNAQKQKRGKERETEKALGGRT